MAQPVRSWHDLEAPFIQGGTQDAAEPLGNLPLGRFFPPYVPGRAAAWLNRYCAPGNWVLDPFGLDPYSVLELAQAGYRTAVTTNNPIAAFVLECLATTSPEDWDEALLLLSNLKLSNGARLEDHLESFYRIPCPNPECKIGNEPGQARVERLIHDDEPGAPRQIRYRCPYCKQEGELNLNPGEADPMPAYPSLALYRARALELVCDPQDALRPLIEDVLKYYAPRPLVMLQLMLHRILNTPMSERQSKLLKGIFLLTADRVNVLWAYPLGRNRPRQLMRPPSFEEINIWQAVLEAAESWRKNCRQSNFQNWPDLVPQTGGISLFRGRLREWDPVLDPKLLNAVYSVLPRRNQAFWNLSALWTGWLWGNKALEPLRHALLRQRYDWTWHTKALEKVLAHLPGMVLPGIPILLQIPELEPRFLLAGVLSAQDAGLQLKTYALEGDDSTLQMVWNTRPPAFIAPRSKALFGAAREAAIDFLKRLGEPASFTMLFTHILLTLQSQDMLHGQPQSQANGTINELENELSEVLADPLTFKRYYANVTADSGLYWLAKNPESFQPLADRVERAVMDVLIQHSSLSHAEVLAAVHEQAPGLQTPDDPLIEELLESYAHPMYENGPHWQLRYSESEARRAADLKEIRSLLEVFANTLNYRRQLTKDAVYWSDEEGRAVYSFFPITTAIVTPLLLKYMHLPGKKVVALPSSKTKLLTFKLKRDPNLDSLVGDDWLFLRFRQLRNLKENPLLNRDLFLSQISYMSQSAPSEQMALF